VFHYFLDGIGRLLVSGSGNDVLDLRHFLHLVRLDRWEACSAARSFNGAPEPAEGRDFTCEAGNEKQFLSVNSVGGSWSDPEIAWHEIESTLCDYGFYGFKSYEETEDGDADMSFPADQKLVIKALEKFVAHRNTERLHLLCGKWIFKSEIHKLIYIFKSGRTIIPGSRREGARNHRQRANCIKRFLPEGVSHGPAGSKVCWIKRPDASR
jgi:hypothetical protein